MLGRHGTWAVVAVLAAGCSVAKSSDTAEKEALERRVAELEQRLAQRSALASPAPAAVASAPVPTAAVEPRHRAARPASAAVRSAPVPAPVEEPARAIPSTVAPAPVVPAPTPLPPPPLVIASGTTLDVVLENGVSSVRSQVGDRVTARIVQASDADGVVTLPGGSYLEGRVASAQPSGRVKGKAQVALVFDRIVVRGRRQPIETAALSFVADGTQRRDAAIVAGGAAAGAIIGAITGGSAGKGAVVGGAAGGGAVLATKGKEVDLPSGASASVRVSRELVIQR